MQLPAQAVSDRCVMEGWWWKCRQDLLPSGLQKAPGQASILVPTCLIAKRNSQKYRPPSLSLAYTLYTGVPLLGLCYVHGQIR